eukprot:COSAG01_NODE_4122_length_5331_cov_11.476873_4_plen_62_part_00
MHNPVFSIHARVVMNITVHLVFYGHRYRVTGKGDDVGHPGHTSVCIGEPVSAAGPRWPVHA